VKRLYDYLRVCSLFALCLPFASAQDALDVHVGVRSFHNAAGAGGLDNASSLNAFGTCSPGSGDTFCQSTGGLGGAFLGIGADIMFSKRFGILKAV
jgi:hypothetical protein